MSRKNSLLEISKAYEQILNEMNAGIPSSAQNPLMSQDGEEGQNVVINNADDPTQITFTATAPPQQSPEEMAAVGIAGSMKHASCSKCTDGQCGAEQADEEEHDVYDDSNLEMAKSEVYKILKCADELMHILDESPKMEAWMLSKLVKASDFVSSVKDVLDYDIYDKEMGGCMQDLSNGMHVVGQITSMLNGEGKEVNEAVIKRARFNLELIKNK
jgi:hypothetical protein